MGDHIKLLCDVSELDWLLNDSQSISTFLGRIVEVVAGRLNADVCSIYLYDDATQTLSLRATKGLNPESVGLVRLTLGEGLTGLVLKELRTVLVNEASRHPNYRFFPETGEERFEAFLGVPILRGTARIGVLNTQRAASKAFSKQDAMALRAVASQLANVLENVRIVGGLGSFPNTPSFSAEEMRFLKGRVGSEGFALGPSTVFDRHRTLEVLVLRSGECDGGPADLESAVAAAREELRAVESDFARTMPDAASIFSGHLAMIEDPAYLGAMRDFVSSGRSAPSAVAEATQRYVDAFSRSRSAYIREKVKDMEDVAVRIMSRLAGDTRPKGRREGMVVFARDLLPSDLLLLASERAAGIVLTSGGITSHLSILARSLKLPLVIVEAPAILGIPEGTEVMLDAELGNVYVQPADDVKAAFRERNEARLAAAAARSGPLPPCATADGTRVRLLANINLLSDLVLAAELGAEGVGLYRTEFPFMVRPSFPTEEEQLAIYRRLVEKMPGRPVTFRTLDVGGDKLLPYLDPETEEQNPFLGVRSIRFSLDRPDVFRVQLRAIMRAGAGADLRIMFPLVSSVEEIDRVREIVAECAEALEREGIEHNGAPRLGAMIEVPSMAEIVPDIAPLLDFFSIGTNDFIQYMLASDRTNAKLSKLYMAHHPAVLRGLARVAASVLATGRELTVCGDMAHDPRMVRFLLGIGIRSFSLNPRYLAKVHEAIGGFDLSECGELARRAMSAGRAAESARELGLDEA